MGRTQRGACGRAISPYLQMAGISLVSMLAGWSMHSFVQISGDHGVRSIVPPTVQAVQATNKSSPSIESSLRGPPRSPISPKVPAADQGSALQLDAREAQGTILILTPVKNAWKHLPRYFRNLQTLTYPH